MSKVDMILGSSGINAEENTWKRKNHLVPTIVQNENSITVRGDLLDVEIGSLEEVIFEIILNFKFCPVWLVEDWLDSHGVLDEGSNISTIGSWIQTGLVWAQNSVTGQYLRPTHVLFDLFGKKIEKFSDIPFNQLTHTISEQDVMFDIMSGRDRFKLLDRFRDILLPKYSPLGIKAESSGTNIIREGEFKSINMYMRSNIKNLEEAEYRIQEAIENKESLSPEIEDFNKFVIAKKINNTGETKKDYRFHIPDLIIPMLRNEGLAQSISIEVELTDKRLNRYIDTLEKYKDNVKFGYLVWFVLNRSISESLRRAYREVGGLGHTRMFIYEYSVPSPSSTYKIK